VALRLPRATMAATTAAGKGVVSSGSPRSAGGRRRGGPIG
jgi:hypothetical protein